MITQKSKSQIKAKCDRLYNKASQFITEMDGPYYNLQPVKWSAKGDRLIRRVIRTADLMLDLE